jgi:hypothetical protein
MAELPMGIPVEIEMILEVGPRSRSSTGRAAKPRRKASAGRSRR